METFKKLVCVVTALTAMISCVGCGSNSNSYETAYDSYCKALVSSDGQAIVDLCPDSYIDYFCENLYVEESDIVSAVNEYISNHTDDISEYANYDSYEFVSAGEPVEFTEDDYLDFDYRDSFDMYDCIFHRQYPTINSYYGYKKSLYNNYGYDDGVDMSTILTKIYASIPTYPTSDIENCKEIQVTFQIDGETSKTTCFGIDNNWYSEDLLAFVVKSLVKLQYGDSEYPEDNKPTELQGLDETFEEINEAAEQLFVAKSIKY